MKIFTPSFFKLIAVSTFSLAAHASMAQSASGASMIGSVHEVLAGISKADAAARKAYSLYLPDLGEASIRIINKDIAAEKCYVFGNVEGYEQATFFLRGDGHSLNGKVIFRLAKKAYDIYTGSAGDVFISPVDISKVICIDYNKYEKNETIDLADAGSSYGMKDPDETLVVPLHESLPGGYGTLYLDFDGENVQGSNWGNINAPAPSFTNANITTIWTAVSEDYSPFNVNVTTDRNVFDNAPANRRMMVIFTPDDAAAPGAGGVAFLNSWGSGEPCWVFNPSVKSAEEAASHESGHTFGLSHDGTSTQGYYPGHANWGPIMGAVYTRPIVHWSKGEYTDANNQEDDLVKINSKVPYRTDDHGNTTATATNLVSDASGNVLSANNKGVIEKRTDLDIFKFNAGNGTVNLTLMAKTEPGSASVPDLDIQARLLDANGNELIKVDPTGVLTTAVTVSQAVSAGTFYLEIDGVGSGTPTTGYSDYGSLGQFFISGTIPPGVSTGIAGINHESGISIYPSPSSGVFTISANPGSACSVEILNSLGQQMLVSEEPASAVLYKEVSLPGIAPGIYSVVIRTEGKVLASKVVIR